MLARIANKKLLSYKNNKITGALTTVVSLFYYIKIPLNLFLKRKEMAEISNKKSVNLLILSIFISFILILLGIFPHWVLQSL